MSYSEESEFYKRLDKWERSSVCIVKLKNDLNIFPRPRRISTMDDSSLIDKEAVYFQYDELFLQYFGRYLVAGSADGYPIYKEKTNSKKYFFLLQEDMKEGNEAEVSELYTNLVLRMILEKPVTVVQVEAADYKAVFENDPNLVWFADKYAYAYTKKIFPSLNPVICMFSEKEHMDQFYAALTERNRDFFMNVDPIYLSDLAKMIENAAKERAKGDSFRSQHIGALSAAILHLLKTSSYIPGKADETQRQAKIWIQRWIDRHNNYDEDHSNCPEVFEELEANLFHLNLTRLVYQNYFAHRHSSSRTRYTQNMKYHYKNKKIYQLPKPAYWNPSNFGWVICEVIEAKLKNDAEKNRPSSNLKELFMKDIFQQPCFRRFLKDETLRENFGKFILTYRSSILKDQRESPFIDYSCKGDVNEVIEWREYIQKRVMNLYNRTPWPEALFRGNYDEDLNWNKFLDTSTLGFYADKLIQCDSESVSVMDTINITTAVLAMYPEKKGEKKKETAYILLEYLSRNSDLGKLWENCIISEEKETDNFKEMKKILTSFDHVKVAKETQKCLRIEWRDRNSDFSSELPLDRIYELYCQSKKEGKEVNPSAGLLWLEIAHRRAIGSLGELSEEQQTNCLEMLESALDDLPLQTIETFFTLIQGFTTRNTSSVLSKTSLLGKRKATDNLEDVAPHDVNNIIDEQGKALEQKQASLKEIEERISAYIAQRKKEETAVLFLLHSEMGIERVKVNANMARYGKGHTTSAGIFVFMTLFEYTDEILDGAPHPLNYSKKTCNYYVLTFTKYLIQNTRVKDIFNKKSQLRNTVWEHIKSSLKYYDNDEQLNDLLTLDWQTYYNRWVAEKPVIGKFDLDLIKYGEKDKIGSGAYGITYTCHYSDFVFSTVYKQFLDASAFHLNVRELDSLMKVQSHPHVVRIFGVVTDKLNTAKGLMMEYCEGGSLDKPKSDFTYDGKKAVHWMAQAASALIFFQKIGVVHLDIKPANMLLCKDHHYLKIADMGITLLAEIRDKIKLETSISQSDNFPLTASREGTNGFMAPEVMGSAKEKMVCSYASDIFSLGRTLWSIYYQENPFDEIVNRTVIMPVFLNPIFDAEDIPEDQTPQAVENITADMENTLKTAMPDNVKLQSREEKKDYVTSLFISYAHAESKPVDMKLKCSERIAKWIIRMTRFDPDARPTAVILHEEFKKQYEEYKRMEEGEVLKETMNEEKKKKRKKKETTLQIIPSTKITFLHPIEVNRSVCIMLGNTSNVEILQWSASSSNEKIAVVPAEGEIPPSEEVKVTLTYGAKSALKENLGNFIVNYRIKMDSDEPEKEWPWATKYLKIVCYL